MEIPVINHLDNDAHLKLDEAFKTIGFAYIKNNDEVNLSNILNHAKEFFSLPLEEKNKYKSYFIRKLFFHTEKKHFLHNNRN